jgi:uncharacterized RmlC-like cupin family protein
MKVVLTFMVFAVLLPVGDPAQRGAPRFASTQLLENNRVRVQRVTVPVGYRDPVSVLQTDMVVIQMSPGEMEVAIGQDRTSGPVDAGKTWYVPKAMPHQFSNAGNTPYDTIIVFLK